MTLGDFAVSFMEPHYGDPLGEQRALVEGVAEKAIGYVARSAVRLGKGEIGYAEEIALKERPGHHVVFLHLDGSEQELPAIGSPVHVNATGDPVGRMTSVAYHYELGPIGLAVVADDVSRETSLIVKSENEGHETLVAASQSAIEEIAAP